MKIAVSTESVNDLSQELINQFDIKIIPYKISIKDEVFDDGKYTTQEIFDLVEKCGVLPKTTAVNEFEYTKYFKSLLKDYDAVIHITLSSGITSSVQNAINASKNLENVFVIDSKSLSTGIGLLAIYARELADLALDAELVAKKVKERVDKLSVSFVIERLDYLYKGGRCSSLQYYGANLLKLRPRIVLRDGKMVSDKKYRGKMESVCAKYAEEIFEEFDTPSLDHCFITYTSATEGMINAIEDICKRVGFKHVYKTFAGGTIACHCGANTIGVLFFNDGTK